MIRFGIRNLKIFFRDRAAIFFSLLAVFIIIGMYGLFLGDVWSQNLQDSGLVAPRQLMDHWIMAGVLAVTPVTTTMGALGMMIEDRTKQLKRDFIVSPIRNWQLIGGYIGSAIVIGILLSVITLGLIEIYLVANGSALLTGVVLLKVIGLIIFTTMTNTAMVLCFVSFFKSTTAFSTASTVVGTLIGFLAGIYLPLGSLPEAAQLVVKVFPVSHAAALFRQVVMEAPLATSFANTPPVAMAEFKTLMGVELAFGEQVVAPWMSIVFLSVTALVFLAIALFNLARKETRK